MADGVVWEFDDAVLEDDDGNVIDNCEDCPCDGIETDCNPSRVPEELSVVINYRCTQFVVTLTYGNLGPFFGWSYFGAGDVELCSGFEFRDFSLWCDGGEWSAEFVYTESGVQQSLTSDFFDIDVISTSPLCIAIALGGWTHCGGGSINLAIGTCLVDCDHNPNLMKRFLNAKITVCGVDTCLPNLIWNGSDRWIWTAADDAERFVIVGGGASSGSDNFDVISEVSVQCTSVFDLSFNYKKSNSTNGAISGLDYDSILNGGAGVFHLYYLLPFNSLTAGLTFCTGDVEFEVWEA